MKVLSMKLNSYTTLGLVSMLTVGGASLVEAQSAWLPQEKEFSVTPSYIFQKFDEFWMGTHKTNPDWTSSIKQHTVSLAVEYGITKHLAADLTIGYTRSEAKFAGETLDGLADMAVGLRYQFLDEILRSGRAGRYGYRLTVVQPSRVDFTAIVQQVRWHALVLAHLHQSA